MNRREVMMAAAATLLAGETFAADKAAKPLKVLVLGGTGISGPHLVRELGARSHKVTLFNRGKRNPGLFPNVETLIGDRNVASGVQTSAIGHRNTAVAQNSAAVGTLNTAESGAAFGLFFRLVSYGIARRSRDFESQIQVLATNYQILIDPTLVTRAQSLLTAPSEPTP